MIKKLLFLLTFIPLTTLAQFSDDFEDGDISNWTQSVVGHWAASITSPISGTYSVQQVFNSAADSRDQISIELPIMDLTAQTVVWRFRVKHGYDPSSANNWGIFLTSSSNAEGMFSGGTANGYVLGVNYSGSDDSLRLWKVINGTGTKVLTTSINWQTQVGIALAPAIEVVKSKDGLWQIRVDINGSFSSLTLVGEGTDNSYSYSDYFGIYYKYSLSQDLKLWFDELSIETYDTISPFITSLNVKTSGNIEIAFNEKMDSVSLLNTLNYFVDGSIGNPDSVSLNTSDFKTVNLFFNEKLNNEQEYQIQVQNCEDLKKNSIIDTILNFTYEYIKPLNLEITSSNELTVTFSRETDISSAENPMNYFLNNGANNPQSATIITNDSSKVLLEFSNNFINRTYYNLSIQDVADRNQDTMLNADLSFLYFIPQPNDIVINEILADPTPEVNLPGYEYVEIFNTTPFDIDITGWEIKIGATEKTLTSYVLDSASYLILCNSSAIDDLSLYGDVLEISSFPTISNSGTTITLSKPDNTQISTVSFSTEWYNDNNKVDGGWSIERIDPLNNCSGINNWRASVDANGGTPGTVNSVYATNIDNIPPTIQSSEVISANQLRITYNEVVDSLTALIKSNYSVNESIGIPASIVLSADLKQVDLEFTNQFPENLNMVLTITNISDLCGNTQALEDVNFSYYIIQPYDILINEIMADPEPVVYMPEYEYIEIFNTTAYNISLSGWTLAVGSTIRTFPSYTIEPNAYLILCSDESYLLYSEYGNTIVVTGFPSLTNSGQTITLRNKESKVISSVSYSDSWYKNVMKADGGWSLEQIDPYNPCGGESNWLASENSNGGTPCQQNSVFSTNPDNNAPELLRIGFLNDTTIQVYFNESIDSISTMQLSNYEVDNSVGYPESISLIGPTYQSVLLNFNNPFLSSIIYTLEITGVTDCTGNEIGTKNSAQFSKPVSPELNDIVINEILFNPRSEGFDFIELYNRSQKTIDLNDLRITAFDNILGDFSSVNDISESSFLFMPGEYLVLTEDPSVVQNQYYTPNSYGFVELSSMPSYNDDAGKAILLDNLGNVIDNMEYTNDMHFALLSTTDGVSLERLNYDRPANDISNWHSASELVGFATPAYENSQFKELAETEDKIKVNPEVFSPDNDGFEDVVDIQLLFDVPGFVANIKIFDSRGRQVKLLANNLLLGIENTITWDGLTDTNRKTPNGIYIIYIEVFDLKGNVKDYRKPVVVAEKY
ncbi:MAG: hypothetical protein A2041_04545 [Bacteroidetes bacterium GWA2_31_9b]|nr:MAG: hypothetical protein A2041_04545 [Bacteroidetes bacterium GWA2_31_9b]